MSYIHHYLILLDNLKHFCANKPRVITPGPSVFLFSPSMIPAGRHSQHLHSDCSPPAPQQEAAVPARPECRKPVAWFKRFKLLPKCEYWQSNSFLCHCMGHSVEIWWLVGSKCSLLTVLIHVLCALEESCCFQWSYLYKQALCKVRRGCMPCFLFSFGPFV